MMLQHAASGVNIGEKTVTGFSERLKEFNWVLEGALPHGEGMREVSGIVEVVL